MDAPQPLLDPSIWARFLAGLALIVVLPGYLLVGRFLGPGRWVARGLYSAACGLLLTPMLGAVLSVSGHSLRAPIYVAAALLLGLSLGRWARWRDLWSHLTPTQEELPVLGWLALLTSVLVAVGIVVPSWGELTAPLGDAANHAFLTWRIDQTGSLLSNEIFAPPHSFPGFTYFAGWHASAALVAQVSGVAPWVVTWLLPVTLLVSLPPAFWLLWQNCGLDSRTASLAALLMGAFHFFPVGLFPWSGFGILVGWFLVPFLVGAVVMVARSRTVLAGVIAGVLVAALICIHATELSLVAVFAAVALAQSSSNPDDPRSGSWSPWFAFLGVVAVGMVVSVAIAGTDYGLVQRDAVGLGTYAEKVRRGMEAQSREWIFLRLCVVPGLILGLLSRRLRWFSVLGLTMAILYLWLLTAPDPVITTITRPFYQEAARLRYTMAFFFPVWIALTLMWAWRSFRSLTRSLPDTNPGWKAAVAVLALAVLLRDAGEFPSAYLRGTARFAPFGPADLEQAHRLGEVLPEGAFVANLHRDGSHFTMQVCGRRFLRPATWPFRTEGQSNRIRAVLALAQDPWPAPALQLRDAGVTHLYVSDTYQANVYRPTDGSGFSRDHFMADPRFRLVDQGENASVFAIDWQSP